MPRPTRARRVQEIGFSESPPYGSQWLLLDSHVWYWLLEDMVDTIRPAARTVVLEAVAEGRVAISEASAWELFTKAHLGRLRTALPPRDWIVRALAAPGLRVIPLSRSVLFDSVELPGDHAPRDPFDRVIIATARREGMSLITADRAILDWSETSGTVRTISAR
jgi:PIN domain nuclease of toxin-antitoxin system